MRSAMINDGEHVFNLPLLLSYVVTQRGRGEQNNNQTSLVF